MYQRLQVGANQDMHAQIVIQKANETFPKMRNIRHFHGLLINYKHGQKLLQRSALNKCSSFIQQHWSVPVCSLVFIDNP